MGIVARLCVFFMLLLSLSAAAQDTPEVHKINGKKYYLHVVEAGNTLYGISKQYNLDIDQITGENPVLKEEGLKVNQTLLIPVTSTNKKELGGVVKENKEFLTHQVQPKQTLFSIAAKYNVKLSAIVEVNPGLKENGLKAGSEIRIPMAEVQPERPIALLSAKPDSLQGHIVKKGETLYALSKMYDVDITMLKMANDGLPIGLKEGMVLRIPGLMSVPVVDSTQVATKKDTLPMLPVLDSLGPLNIGLLFPFHVTFPDSGKTKDFEVSKASRVSLNFYKGVQFGLDSLFSDHSRQVNVKVFDTGSDTARIRKWIADHTLDSLDIILGPFYTDQYTLICDSFFNKNVPIICPVPKPSKILFKRPLAFKTIPSQSMQLHSLAQLLAADYQDQNLIVVNSNKATDEDNLEFFKARYREALGTPDTVLDPVIREIQLWDINRESLTMRFGDSGSYTVVVPSNNRVFISQFLSGLYDLGYNNSKYDFTVIGLEDWLKMEDNLDIRHLQQLKVTLAMPSYLDFDDYKIKAFMKAYRAHFGHEADAYSMKGFDLVYYLKTQLDQNPSDWIQNPEAHSFEGVYQSYFYKRITPGSGIENRYIELYRYEQFRLKKVDSWPRQKMK